MNFKGVISFSKHTKEQDHLKMTYRAYNWTIPSMFYYF